MASLHLGFTLLVVTACAVAQDPSVDLQSRVSEVTPGSSFTIQCDAKNIQSGVFHRFEKYFMEESEPVTFATNSRLTPKFQNTRYFLTFAPITDGFSFTLNVTDAKPEDSGDYACGLYNADGILVQKKHTINVVDIQDFRLEVTVTRDSNPSEVFFFETGTEEEHDLMLDESEDFTVQISTSASNPAPAVSVRVGGRSITDQFVLTEKSEVYDGDLSLKGVRYSITGEAVVHVDHSFTRGMTVRASVGEQASVEETFTAKFSGFPPQLESQCPTVIEAGNHEMDVSFNCTFLSSEMPTMYIYYNRKLESGNFQKVILQPDEYNTHYTVRLEEGDDGQTYYAFLEMPTIYPQMFRSHYLVMENTRGNLTHEFIIERDMDAELNASSQVLASVAGSVVLAVMTLVFSTM